MSNNSGVEMQIETEEEGKTFANVSKRSECFQKNQAFKKVRINLRQTSVVVVGGGQLETFI